MTPHMTPHMQDELFTLAEVALAMLVTVGLVIAAFLVGTWTA